MENVPIVRFFILIILLNFTACSGEQPQQLETNKAMANQSQGENDYQEKGRPQFHFSPPEGWMNDPNGMVYYDGEYHLCYQFYPYATSWGPMHWGHAVSKDLLHWEHLPIALYPDEQGMIFSGSAVVDWKNTSGLGEAGIPPLIAIYTGHHTEKPLQDLCGKALIVRVYERLIPLVSKGAVVVVATDSDKVAAICSDNGIEAVLG